MNSLAHSSVQRLKLALKTLTRWAGYDGFKRIPTLEAVGDRIVFKVSLVHILGMVIFYLAYRLTE